MADKEFALITIETESNIDIQEFCQICHITPELVLELVEYGVLIPKDMRHKTWYFDVQDLKRVRKLLRLQQDLEVNLAGAALALDLIQQIGELKAELEAFKKYFK